MLINCSDMWLTNWAWLDTHWYATDPEWCRIFSKLAITPDIQGSLVSSQGKWISATGYSLYIVEILNLNWFMDVVAVLLRYCQLAFRIITTCINSSILGQEKRVRITSWNLTYLFTNIDSHWLEPEIILISLVYSKLSQLIVTTRFHFITARKK